MSDDFRESEESVWVAEVLAADPKVWSLTQFYSVDFSVSRLGVDKVRFQQTHNQGLRQLFLSVFWDLLAYRTTPDSVLVSM